MLELHDSDISVSQVIINYLLIQCRKSNSYETLSIHKAKKTFELSIDKQIVLRRLVTTVTSH